MAESLLRKHGSEFFEAHSAGLTPGEVHPLTREVLQEIGIDTQSLESKDLKTFLGRTSFQYAIILCEKTYQNCPRLYPFALQALYWPFQDPAAIEGSKEEQLSAFRRVRDEIEARVRSWLSEGIQQA